MIHIAFAHCYKLESFFNIITDLIIVFAVHVCVHCSTESGAGDVTGVLSALIGVAAGFASFVVVVVVVCFTTKVS